MTPEALRRARLRGHPGKKQKEKRQKLSRQTCTIQNSRHSPALFGGLSPQGGRVGRDSGGTPEGVTPAARRKEAKRKAAKAIKTNVQNLKLQALPCAPIKGKAEGRVGRDSGGTPGGHAGKKSGCLFVLHTFHRVFNIELPIFHGAVYIFPFFKSFNISFCVPLTGACPRFSPEFLGLRTFPPFQPPLRLRLFLNFFLSKREGQ